MPERSCHFDEVVILCNWFYAKRTEAALKELFGYELRLDQQRNLRKDIASARRAGLSPREAASELVEAALFAVRETMGTEFAAFASGKIDRWLDAMRANSLARDNAMRIARVYAYLRGVSVEQASLFAQRTIREWTRSGFLSEDGTRAFGDDLRHALAFRFRFEDLDIPSQQAAA